jgi:hypothetical protein
MSHNVSKIIVTLALVILSTPVIADAQQPLRIPLVGVLEPGPAGDEARELLRALQTESARPGLP